MIEQTLSCKDKIDCLNSKSIFKYENNWFKSVTWNIIFGIDKYIQENKSKNTCLSYFPSFVYIKKLIRLY